MSIPAPAGFPGTLYDGDGTRLAGNGPELTLEMTEGFPFKALLHDRPGAVDVAVLAAGDRFGCCRTPSARHLICRCRCSPSWQASSGAAARSAWLRTAGTPTRSCAMR